MEKLIQEEKKMRSVLENIRHRFQEIRDQHNMLTEDIEIIYSQLEKKKFRTLPLIKIEQIFGKFEYTEKSNGGINILNNWQNDNIIILKVNDLTVWCHKLIAPQLAGAFSEIYARGLQGEVNFEGGGGCFVPRHKCWDPKRGLSFHSWGITLDIRPREFPYGSSARQNPYVVSIFRKWGFFYGGDFRTPDPMHYEWCRFVI